MPGNFIQDDIDTFLNLNDFGSSITITPVASGSSYIVNGIYDNEANVFDVQTAAFISSGPQIQFSTTDILNMNLNDKVQVSGVSGLIYYVQTIKPDGTGITSVALSQGKISTIGY